ncbi:mucin-19-like isoform X3 [Branchiostoma lanceolatum]|uniref:mucin-19-like isoform X3 n=1 Tax=Branchiostoma lanceolatum TaxID=7740 RepID=UPI003456A388
MIRGYGVETARGRNRHDARYGSRGGSDRGTPPDTRHESRFRFSGEYGQPERSPPAYPSARGGLRTLDIIKRNVQDSMEGKPSRPQSLAGDLPASRYDRDFGRRSHERDFGLKRSPDREYRVFKREAFGSYRSLQAGYSGRQDDTDSLASVESWKGMRIGPPKKPRVSSTSSEHGFDMRRDRESHRDRDTSFGGYSRERRPSGDSVQSVTEGMLERRRFDRDRGPKSPLDEAWDRDRAQGYRDRRSSEDRAYHDRDRGTGTYRDRGYSDSDRKDLGRDLDLSSDRGRDREADRDRDRYRDREHDRDRDYKRTSRDLSRLEEGGEEAARYIEKIQELEDRQEYLEDKIRALGGRPEPLSRAEEELQQEVEEAHTELDAVTVLKAKLETEVNKLRKETEDYRRRVDGERQARYAAEETFRKVQAEYSELRGVIDDINGQIDASRERLRLIKYEHNEEKRHLQSRLGDDAGSDRSGGSYTHYSRDLYSYRRRDTHSREHHDYDSSANKRRLFEMMASVEMEVSELQRVRREIVRQQELVRTLHIDIHTLQFREDELRKVANDTDKRHGREVDIRDNVVTKLQQEVATATDQLLQQKFQNQQLLDDAMLLDAQLKTYRRLWDLSEGRLGTSGRRPLALPAPPSMPAGRTWGALTKMDTTVTPGYAPPPIKRDYGITTRTGTSTTRISYVTSATARKTTSRTSTDQDDAPGGKFAKIEVRGQTTRKDTTPTLTATQTIRIGPPKNPGESGFIHQVSRTDQDQVDTSAAVTMETSGESFSGQSIVSQPAGVAYGQVTSVTPQVEQQERIMVTVTEGKVTGAKQLKSGQTKELSPIETQQIMASIPAETAQKSGNIMVTVTEGQVVETKAVTEKEAKTIVSLVTEEGDPTAEKVVVSVEGGQVVGKRVGKDKATTLSPQEAAQLWRSVAQPGQQTGDVVVSLKQGQIVGSQQLTPTEAETIKAVVVEEPKPTVCVTPGQPAFTSIVPTPAQLVAPQKDKIMVTVTDGKVTGAKQLKSGETKELSPLETQQIMASVPAETAQKSGNIMVTVTEGKVVETKSVTVKEAETIVSLVTEQPDPTAEKVVVSIEGGQVVGKRVGKDKATPLSPQEAAQLWRSVAQPGQQTGDVVVSLKQGQIVGSQQLTPTEAETIKSVVTQEAQAIQVIQTSQQVQPGGSVTLQQPGVFGAVQPTQVFSSGVQAGGMVAPGTIAPGTVAPGTVAPGTIPFGSVAPGTVAPGTQVVPGIVTPGTVTVGTGAPGIVDPGTVPFGTVASGTVSLGSVAPGTVAPGTVAPGTVPVGTVAPGTVAPGTVAPGTVAPGTVAPGIVAPGTVAPATQAAPGIVAPGTVPFGTVASGTVPLGSVAPGTVAPGTVAFGTVAPGTVAPGTVAPGSVAFGTVAPGTVVPGTVAFGTVAPGTVAPGTVAPGTVAFGTVAPGTVVPGTVAPGTVAPGTVAFGTVAPGTVAPGTVAPGTVAPGTVAFGTVAPGTVAPGSVAFGTVAPGTVVPGTVAFGTVAPGIVVPGNVAPGTGAIVTGTVTESGSVSTGTVAPGGVAPAPGTTTSSEQIQEYLPPFARHPLPPISLGDAPATAGSEMPLSPSSTTVMASIEDGNIVRARRLNFGKFEDFSPQEAEQMLSGLPERQATQSGNVMAMISEGKIIKSQQLSPWVAEQLIATMSGSAPGQVTVPVSGQATYVPAPGSPPVTVPVFGQAKISPTIVEKPVTPVSGEAKFFTGQEPAVVDGQRTPLQGTASQQVAGSSVITQQATVTVSGMTPGFQAAPIQTTPASTVPAHGFHPNIQQVYDETLPTLHTAPHVLPMIPETLPDTSERIVASFSDGKIVGAQKIVNGRTVQVDPAYAESALATAPSQAALQSGTIMMSMVDGKVQDTKPLTPAEAQYVAATATIGDAGQAVPYTTPGLQQFGGSQTGQTVSSSQVYNYQTTTPSSGQQVLQPSEKIMMTIDEGKVVGAVQLKNGESTQIPASEAEKMLAVSGQPGQQSGNVMLTVSEGAVLDTQQVTPREAETIVSTLTAQPDPTAETIMVRFVNGQVVGAEKTFREQASTLSAPEAQMLLSSVPNQPTPQTGNILLIKSEGRIVESQELTATEADTIMTTVFKKAPQQSLIQQQPQFASVTQTQPAFPSVQTVTQQQDRIVVTVADGKVTGAKDLKTGQQKQLSPIEAQQIMASAPAGTAQQTGNIMVTVTDGKIAESKPVTQREAETIASVVAEQSDPTAEKVVVSVEGGQVVGKRVGKDKATPLSPQEAAQLWRSVAQPGQQTGDVVVSLKQGQIVGSQQLTPTEAETIKAVVVEEPKPTVCVTPGQPAFTSVIPTVPEVAAPKEDKIMVTVTDGRVTGAKQLKAGETKELSTLETQQIMASVPTETAQQSGNIMVTVTEGKVVESKTVTEKEAETIVSLVTEEKDPAAEKVVVSVEDGQVVGKRVGKDKATPLSPQEAAQLWRSVAQPGQQTGDVVVSLKQGQIVGSQQLTPTEAETIKAVVVEEPKPTVCVTPGQPAFTSVIPTAPEVTAPQEDKIMVTVTDGKVTGAKQLKAGETKELSPLETQQIMASVPADAAQKSGNIMVTVTDGKVVDTKPVTEREAETIVSLVTEEEDPTAEKVVVSVEKGQVVGKRVGKDKATPLSPQEAAQLWRSVAQPGQQTGDVVVSLKQGQIVGSQQLTPTEAETIKAVVVEEPKPAVCVFPTPTEQVWPSDPNQPAFTSPEPLWPRDPNQPAFTSIVPTTAQLVAPQKDKIMVTVTDGKVTGAKQLKSGQTKELSSLETQQIMASVPSQTAQQSGNIMVTVTDGKVVETKTVTEKEAETIVSLVTEEADPTAEKVVVSVEEGQVVGKRVGKDKSTPLSPQEAAQLWRSVAQPGQQTGDVVVSLKQGQILGSQQLTPTEAETIKAVVVEEPKPTVCVTPGQPAFTSVIPTAPEVTAPKEDKIMVTVTDGKVTGAKQLKAGETKELSLLETQQIMASVPTETAQKSGNIMVTVTEGKVVDTKPVTEREAETIVSLVTEEADPTAEKVVVSIEEGQVVGKRVGKDKSTPLSPQEAAQLWRSVAQPGQQTGDVVVSLKQGQIVGSQQLTPTEAETIKAVVVEEPKPTVCVTPGQPAFTSVIPTVPEVAAPQEDKIMVTVTDGKVTGAKQLKSGETKELSPFETQQIMASVPAVSTQKSGNIMVTVAEGKVVDTKPVTEREAETIVSLVTEEADPTAEKVVVSVEKGQVVGKRVGKDKATPLSPQEAAQLWRSVAQPGQQTGDVVVSLKQGQIVGSQQLTPTEAETIKAVVVEEPKPTVCVTPGQPAFTSVIPTVPEVAARQEDKIMVTVTDGKVTGAKHLKSGETKELSPLETQQIMASVPAVATQKSGNIMVTVTEGKVVDTKPVTEKEAETIVSLVTEEADPTAEKVVVSVEEGQVVGKRVGKDKSTPLSPQEAAQLWRSVAQPGQQTGDVVVSLKQGQIVGSQQLTPTEAETIKAVVVEEPKPTVCVTPGQPAFTSVIQTAPEVTEPQEDKIMVTVTDGKVTGAKQLKSGETKELSPFETQQIMASVPAETAPKSGNIMVTVTEGKVVDTKPVTEREAETIVSLVTEETDPTAEKVVVSVEKGQVVGKRVGKDKSTPLSPQEAAQLWRSVAQPGQQTGDVVVSIKQGQIVGSRQLTPTEAETIKAVVVEEPKPTVCVTPGQPAFTSVIPTVPEVMAPKEDKIMVTVSDGKVTGAKQLKSGETKELSPLETQQIMASVPAVATQKSGNIMVTVTDGKVVDTKPVTEREAETIVSLVTEEADPTAEKVVVSVEGGQVVGKRVGKDKATPLSPQEAAQLWRSVAQPGQQTGDVVVSLKQGQIVGSQQLTPTEAETIKAVVVEEPKPTVCVTSDQPAFSSVVPTPSTFVSTEPIAAMKPVTSEKIIVNVANGKVAGAKHLRPGDLKDLSPVEAQEILAHVPVQKPGNVILTVADGKVVESKRVTEVEAENIMSLVSEEISPEAEKVIVTLEGGEIVGKRVGKDKTTPLSPREAEELWRSVSHPGQISGDVMVSLSKGRIVKSQQLTPTEAETIKVVVEEKAKPTVKVSSGLSLDRAPGQDIRGSETLMATIVDGKVVGARKLTDGVTTQVSTAEAEEIISSVPGQSSQTGHVLATLSGNEVVEVQQLTPKDAEEITVTGTIPRAIGTAPGEKVLLTVAGGRVAEAQKVGLRTLTPLSPTEGQKLLESASSKTKEPGDIAVTIVDGKVVGSRWVSSKLGSTQVDGNVPTSETAVIRKVVMTPSGERVVQEVVAPRDAPASEMALAGDYGKRVKVEVLEGRAAMKEFLAGSSTDSDTDAYMTPRSDQSDAYVSASSDAYVTPPSERSDAYVTPPGEPMDYSGAADEQDGKSWFAQVTDKVTSAFFSPGTEGDTKVTEGTVPVESSIERSTSAEDIFVDAEQGRPIPATGMDVSASTGFDKGPRPLQIGGVREETVVPSVQPGRQPTESDEGRPKQRTVSEVARAVIPPVSVKTGEMKTEPQFFGQSEVQESAIRPEHVGTDEPVKTRRTTSDLAEEIIGPLANSASPQKGDVFFTEVPESEEAARKKRTELEYFRHVSLESEDAADMTPDVLAELKERAAEDDTRKSSRVSFSTGPPEVIGTTENDEDRRKPIATITMEKTEKTPVGDVKLAPAAKVAGKEPGKPTWNKVWPEKPEDLPADVTTMETVEVEEYQLAPGVGRAGVRLQWKIDKTKAVPAFTKKLTTMLAKEGSTFEAAVRVSGDPQPDITWYHHDKPLKPTDKLDIVKDEGYSSLVFMEVLPEHAGLYSCVATNVMGRATSRAPLVITDEMDSELPMPGAVISDEGELEAEGEDEAPALPPRLIDDNDDRALPSQLQPAVPAGRGRTDSSSVSSVEPDVPDVNARDAKSAVVKELKEYQATSPIFKTPPFKMSKEELEGGVTMVTPTVDGEKLSPGKVEITTPASKVAGVSVDSKAEVTTPQAEVTTPTGGVGIEAVRLPSGSALPAPVKPEKKKSGLKKMFSGRKKKDKEAKKGTPTSGKAGVTPTSGKAGVTPETKPAEGEDEVFSPAVTLGAEAKPVEGQKAPTKEETVLTISTTEKKSSLTRGTARPGDLPVAIGEVVWAEPGKGATPKGSAGRTPSAELKTPTGGRTPSGELRTPSTGGRTPSAEELGSEKKKTGWSKFKRTFSVKKKKKSSSSSSSIDRIPYEQRQAYASGSLPRSAEKYSELSRSTSATMPVRPISMVSPGERPDLSRASLRTSSSTSSASSNKDKKETRPYSYAGHLDFDPRSPGYHQQRPDLPFVEAEVLPAGGTKAVAGVAASERNGKAEDSDDTETGTTLSSKVVASAPSPVLTSSSTFVTSSSKFVSSSTTETVTVSGEEKAGTAGAKLPTSMSAPTGFGAGPASGTGGATLTATVSRTSVATTASRASVALEDSEDSAREATDNFPKYLGGKKKYRKKKGQKQQCKQQ